MRIPACVAERLNCQADSLPFWLPVRTDNCGLSLYLIWVINLASSPSPVDYLQEEHAVVVDHVEEDDDVEYQSSRFCMVSLGQPFLGLSAYILAQIKMSCPILIERLYPPGVEAEEEKNILVWLSLPFGYESLMLRFDWAFFEAKFCLKT